MLGHIANFIDVDSFKCSSTFAKAIQVDMLSIFWFSDLLVLPRKYTGKLSILWSSHASWYANYMLVQPHMRKLTYPVTRKPQNSRGLKTKDKRPKRTMSVINCSFFLYPPLTEAASYCLTRKPLVER
jgi:hypothetical protein